MNCALFSNMNSVQLKKQNISLSFCDVALLLLC